MDASCPIIEQEVAGAGNSVSGSPIVTTHCCRLMWHNYHSFSLTTHAHLKLLQESAYLSVLFSLVTGQQLSSACKMAHKHRDHKLALLFSQAANSSLTTRLLLKDQLNEWERLKVSERERGMGG